MSAPAEGSAEYAAQMHAEYICGYETGASVNDFPKWEDGYNSGYLTGTAVEYEEHKKESIAATWRGALFGSLLTTIGALTIALICAVHS